MSAVTSADVRPGAPEEGPPVRRHILGLDGLRALAALLVLTFHVQVFVRPGADAPWSGVAAVGWVGVDVFFAISGFILFIPFARAAVDSGAPVRLASYARHRARRILPAYWLNLLFLLALVTPVYLTSVDGWRVVITNASFTARYLGDPLVNGVAWTLFCEVVFYAVLPLLARAFTGWRWTIGLPMTVAVAVGYKAFWIARLSGSTDHSPLREMLETFPAVMDEFAMGMTAAAVWVLLERRRSLLRPALAVGLAVLGVTTTATALWLIQGAVGPTAYWNGTSEASWAPLLTLRTLSAAGAALVIIGVCYTPTFVTRLLEAPPVRYVGVVSYGVYLWHLPVAKGVAGKLADSARPNLAFGWAMALTALMSVALAAVSYHFVEKRFLTRRQAMRVE